MLNNKFLIKNIKKIYKNLKNKNYIINKKIIIFFYKKNRNIKLKFLILKLIKKKIKNFYFKKYFFKIKYIFLNYTKLINKNFKSILFKIPNIIHYIIYKKNKIIKVKNYEKKKFLNNFKKKFFNLNISNKISGRGFNYICGGLSLFYKEIENYIMNLHIKENNFKYLKVPNIMKFKSLLNSCHIPKFIKKLFIIKNKKRVKYLIPTSEVSIVNLMNYKNIKSKYIPIKLVSKTECYRNENLSYGKINKSIIRQKQFEKIELFYYTDSKNSYRYLKELIKHVEKIVKNFKINYRIILLSKKEISYISTLTYDIEVWLPSINNYCEISSCSNLETYQSNRSKIKYYNKKWKENLNTINGSGVAIGRLFLSILEKYILKNKKKIKIPNILKSIKKFKFLNL